MGAKVLSGYVWNTQYSELHSLFCVFERFNHSLNEEQGPNQTVGVGGLIHDLLLEADATNFAFNVFKQQAKRLCNPRDPIGYFEKNRAEFSTNEQGASQLRRMCRCTHSLL